MARTLLINLYFSRSNYPYRTVYIELYKLLHNFDSLDVDFPTSENLGLVNSFLGIEPPAEHICFQAVKNVRRLVFNQRKPSEAI